MTDEQLRTAAPDRDRSPDHEYSLSVEQTADLYAKAGHPRTKRAIQKYCALSKLDCHKVETETGEKYLVAPYSVIRHIAYINEVRPVATGRDHSRPDASVRPLEIADTGTVAPSTSESEQPRLVAPVHPEESRYVSALERENSFLRDQVGVKDGQIKEMTERARETNVLIAGLQKMLTPLLGSAGERHREPQADN